MVIDKGYMSLDHSLHWFTRVFTKVGGVIFCEHLGDLESVGNGGHLLYLFRGPSGCSFVIYVEHMDGTTLCSRLNSKF